MISNKLHSAVLFASTLAIFLPAAGLAQATRTWVSGVGDDANPCSRTAPCKTFAGAISKTATGGEINTLDPGGFGGVTITKSINIISSNNGEAGVLVGGTNGITVSGAGIQVTLKGLVIDGLGAGSPYGVSFLNGALLTIIDCKIMEFSTAGIYMADSSTGTLNVINTVVVNNGTSGSATSFGGIYVKPGSGIGANVVLDGVQVLNNFNDGIRIDGTGGAAAMTATIRNSMVTGNQGPGIFATGSGGITAMIDTTTSSNNTSYGIRSTGTGTSIYLTNSSVTRNSTGLITSGGGTIVSFGNNNVTGNSTDGNPTSTTSAQ